MQVQANDLLRDSSFIGHLVVYLSGKSTALDILLETAVERRYDMNGILLLVDDYGLFISLKLALCDGINVHLVFIVLSTLT